MSQIGDFLRARYVAQRECEMGKRRSILSAFDGHDVEIRYEQDEHPVVLVDRHPYPADKYLEAATEPAPDPDVIADLDAKLALIDEHPAALGWDGDNLNGKVCRTCGEINHDGELTGDPYPCRTLRILVQPFAGHPDHKGEEWAP